MQTIIQNFEWYTRKEDKLWERTVQEAQRLKDIGFTDVWLPPAYKAKYGDKDAGYGVYDLYDMGEFDQKGSIETKYGSEAAYNEAAKALQERGLRVIADIVLNHKLGADETEWVNAVSINPSNRHESYGERKILAWTRFKFEGRKNHYSDFQWTKDHFTSVDYDENTQSEGLFRFIDHTWSDNVDCELGNYDYLMGADVDFNNPEVIAEYTRWGLWYLDKYNLNGVRLDAVKHIQFDFFANWLSALRKTRNVFAIGEYWSSDLRALNNYLMESAFSMMLFDVPLHFNLFDASIQKERYDLRNIFKNTLVMNHPQFAVTFVDNHDTQEGQSLESWIQPWFRESAYALILLRSSGIPCVFYPDIENENIQKMVRLRQNISGERIDMFDEAHCVGWTYNNETGLVVLICNAQTSLKKMFVGVHHAGAVFYDVLNHSHERVIINELGIGMFKVMKESVSVYTRED